MNTSHHPHQPTNSGDILGERAATITELTMLKPVTARWRYTCGVMVLIMLLMVLLHFPSPWVGLCAGGLGLAGFWYSIRRKTHPRHQRVTIQTWQLEAEFSLPPESAGDGWGVRFHTVQGATPLTGYTTQALATALDKQYQPMTIEIEPQSSRIVSVKELNYSLEQEASHTPRHKPYHVGLCLGWALAALLNYQTMDKGLTQLSIQAFLHSTPVNINSVKTLQHHDLAAGMKLTLKGYRYCYMDNLHVSHRDLPTSVQHQFCQHFAYADVPLPYTDQPFTSKWLTIWQDFQALSLTPKISQANYQMLKQAATERHLHLLSRNEIVVYHVHHLQAMSHFINQYCHQLADCTQAKSTVLDLWQKMTKTQCRSKDCWSKMTQWFTTRPANNDNQIALLKASAAAQKMRVFHRMKTQIYNNVLSEYSDYLNNFDGDIQITLVHSHDLIPAELSQEFQC